MKKNHLIALAAIVALLACIRFFMGRSGPTAQSVADAGIVALVDEEIAADEIGWLEVQGAAGDDGDASALRVERRDGGEWVIASSNDAPAEGEKIDEFLESVLDLEGELRGETAENFEEFGVADGSSLRVSLGRAGSAEGAVSLVVGKAGDGPDAQFVRDADGDLIYHAHGGLRRALGQFGEGSTIASDHWLDKLLLDLAEADIVWASIQRADASWELRRAVPAPPVDGQTQPAAASWEVVSPVLDLEQRETGLSSIVSRLGRLQVSSVVDAAEVPQCELSGPTTVVAVREASGAEHRYRVGTEQLEGDQLAVRMDGRSHCFTLSKWTAQNLAPRASMVYQLDSAFEDAPAEADIGSVTVDRGGQDEIALRRDGDDGWKLTAPTSGPAQSARVSRLVNSLITLRMDDLVQADAVSEAAREPVATVTAQAGSRRLKVEILGVRPGTTDDRYARVDGAVPEGWLGVVSGYAVASILPEVSELEDAGEGG